MCDERPRPPSVFLFGFVWPPFRTHNISSVPRARDALLFFFRSSQRGHASVCDVCANVSVCMFILTRRSEMKTSEQATKSQYASVECRRLACKSLTTLSHTHTLLQRSSRFTTAKRRSLKTVSVGVYTGVASSTRLLYYYSFSFDNLSHSHTTLDARCSYHETRVVILTTQFQTTLTRAWVCVCVFEFHSILARIVDRCGTWNGSRKNKQTEEYILIQIIRFLFVLFGWNDIRWAASKWFNDAM